jgi:hypothetical protein
MEEFELYPKVCQLLSDKGYYTYQSFPHSRYSPFEVDVLGFKADLEELFMVEVKLCHINKALRQGLNRLPYSDYVSLAFPQAYADYVYNKFRLSLESKGFGLITIDGTAKEIIAPKRSTALKAVYKKSFLREVYKRFSMQQVK